MLRNFRSFPSGNERSRFAAAGSCAHSGAACPAALAMRMNDKPPFACITSLQVHFARKERQIRAPGHASSRWNHQTRQHTETPAVLLPCRREDSRQRAGDHDQVRTVYLNPGARPKYPWLSRCLEPRGDRISTARLFIGAQ